MNSIQKITLAVVVALFWAVPFFTQAQAQNQILPLKSLIIDDFKATNEPVLQIIDRLANKVTSERAASGRNPIPIVIDQSARLRTVKRNFHVKDIDFYTLIEYLTVGSGLNWQITNGTIVVFSTPKLSATFARIENMGGRSTLRRYIVREISFKDVPLTQVINELNTEAKKLKLPNLKKGGPAANFKSQYQVPANQDFNIRATFINTDLDTIFEIITQQAEKVDWTIRNGNIEFQVQADYLRKQTPSDLSSPVDPFAADPGGFGFGGGGGGAVGLQTITGGEGLQLENSNFNTESYDNLTDNPFLSPLNKPLSTFSIDVDTASYSNLRRFLGREKRKPPIDAVRIEEMVNYFDYDYPAPKFEADEKPEHPFTAHMEVASSPWKPKHRLVKIGLKGYEVAQEDRPLSNLVFLLDVSGSMSSPNKLGLVKESMKLLIRGLNEQDRVAIVVYAGASGLVLDSTAAKDREKIVTAINNLSAGGSTNAGEGIDLAYKVATDNLVKDGNNRVILCTDGDFNVGTTDRGSLKKKVEAGAAAGVQLTILGFGMRNYKDGMLESLSNAGDGNYGYIDNQAEARKLFVQRLQGTLLMIAKDVKIQVEFNPKFVNAYRLLGYENRLLKDEDFANDKIDAGDIGAGHTVTALYEIVPTGVKLPEQPGKIPLKYQESMIKDDAPTKQELLTLKLRYKRPNETKSRLIETPAIDTGVKFDNASRDFQFASAVAGIGMLLRNSPHKGAFTYEAAIEIAQGNIGVDPFGERKELIALIRTLVW